MHDSLGGAQELREERRPSASRTNEVHYLGDNGRCRVELAAEVGQFTGDPLMLGVRPVQERYSRSRIEQQRP